NYPYNGSIVNYNISSKKFNVFQLTKDAGIPISITEDDKKNLWLNDHEYKRDRKRFGFTKRS
ncbi:MAG TPA: hypothetical protein VJ697_03740, partial [Nitrososphaeraceae archaeon]|nr:hypothetical protein [Nitrososphaeraceae archaeon]